MTTVQVQSSTIKSLSYDESKEQMQILFKGGERYLYEEFPIELWNQFINSESKGRYFNSRIKNDFQSTKL